jgi:hypothetical protein
MEYKLVNVTTVGREPFTAELIDPGFDGEDTVMVGVVWPSEGEDVPPFEVLFLADEEWEDSGEVVLRDASPGSFPTPQLV